MRNQKGFTLIELIIVIVVLGILAVTAAPQFIDFSGDARTSSVKGLSGNIKGAANTVYGKAAIEGELTADGAIDLDEDGTDDIQTVFGYPEATASGITIAASLDAAVLPAGGSPNTDWAYLIEPAGSDPSSDPGVIYIAPADNVTGTAGGAVTTDITDSKCYVEYTAATSADNSPSVNTVVTGC